MGHVKDRWFSKSKQPTDRYGKGLRWQIKYRVDGKERDGGSYAVKAVAERKLVELEANLLRGIWVDPNDRTTLSEYAARWLAGRPHGSLTAIRVESMIRTHLDGTPLGSRRLVSVLPSEVQAWATDRAKVLAPTTLHTLTSLLSSIYNAAVLDRLVGTSPVVQLALPSTNSERIVPLTVEEVRSLAKAMAPRFRAAVYVQAGLGLRIGELLALRVQDIDFLRRTARVEHQVGARSLELVPPKTPQSRRTLPLPAMVGNVLSAQIATTKPGPGGLLWYTSTNRPVNPDFYREKFTAAATKAKLPKGTSPHDLRHHYASVLIAAGESVVAVAERLGHDGANLVLSTYAHLMPDTEDRTRKAIDGAWSELTENSGASQARPQ